MKARIHVSQRLVELLGDLPKGWVSVMLGDLAEFTLGGDWGKDPNEQSRDFMKVRVVRGTDFKHWNEKRASTSAQRAVKESSLEKRRLRVGDIVVEISGGGPSQPVGRTVLIDEAAIQSSDLPLICSNFFRLLRLRDGIEPAFIDRFLNYAVRLGAFDDIQTQTTNLRNLNFTDFLQKTLVHLPPLREQRRIVAKLDALLSKVSLTQKRLARIPDLLKRFRQSVLAAACSGRLTADWREENGDVESADDLLERIAAERFDLWCHVAKAKARADERTLRGDAWKSRYVQPITIDCESLGDLPETWKWTPFDTFSASFQYGPRFGESEYTTDGVPTVRTSDMNFRGEITLNNPPRVVVPENSREHFLLQAGDLVVTRTGATIGKCALYHASLGPVIASAYLIRYRLTRTTTVPQYLLTVLMSPWGQRQLLGGVTAVAQPNINTTTIAQIPIPLPPLPEQHEIVRRVEQLFAFADQIESRHIQAQSHVDRLAQSILAKALTGGLVLTEAELARQEGREFESAQQLLERIGVNGSKNRFGPSASHSRAHSERRPLPTRGLGHR